jgi:hypothetical protein
MTREEGIDVDTLFYEQGIASPPVLVGTTVLTGRLPVMTESGGIIQLIDVKKGQGCEAGREFVKNASPEIEMVWQDSTQLMIHTTFNDNCCYDFLGSFTIESDTLVLYALGYNMHCSCTCCHELIWEFSYWGEERAPAAVRMRRDEGAVIAIPEP